jgi:hypothetical protein
MESGEYVSGGILQPTATSTTLKLREGQKIITDGPFAEAREQLAGYLMVDASDLDAALEIASQHPVAQIGSIEIRPVREVPFLPSAAIAKLEGSNQNAKT